MKAAPPATCATCRHWIRSHLEHHQGEGVCVEYGSGPKPRHADYRRPLYVRGDGWCDQHERPQPRQGFYQEKLA